jgi:uncharacterized protein (UPF0332 family)
LKFIERFNIDIGQEEAKRRLVNRAYNRVFYNFFYDIPENTRYQIHREIVSALGDKYSYHKTLSGHVEDDFYRSLLALETFFKSASSYYRSGVDKLVKQLLEESEIDLGVRWENGRFIKSGAKLLDDKLVNDILDWLRDKRYSSVLAPFEKGLDHFLHSDKRPELLADVVTDMYEALEALSKIITERPNKDLSANRELFISNVKASNEYKKILAEYINYANEFRHASEEGKNKPAISQREAESFIYLTGVFIRLAVQ